MKKVFSIIMLLSTAAPASSEALDDAWAIALSSHRLIAAAMAGQDAANAELDRARGARLPQFGLSTAYTQLDQAPAFSFSGMTTAPIFDGDDFVQADARVSLPLYTGGAVSATIDAAASGVAAAAGTLEAVTQDIKLGVAEHYVAVLRAERAVDVAQSNVATLTTHTDYARDRYEYGAVPKNDFLAASVTLANAQQRLLQAENGLDYARAAYNRFLGRELDAPVSLDPTLDIDRLFPGSPDLANLIATARHERPELAALEENGRALRRQAEATRASTRPQLALTSGYMLLENEFLDDDEFWMTGVAIRWNLFDGGQSRRRAAALDHRALAVSHDRAEFESVVALQVRRAWNDRIEASNRLDVAQSAVTQAAENLRVVTNRYQAGASTNVEVLDAEALRTQALSNRDDARFEVALAKLRLARAVGAL